MSYDSIAIAYDEFGLDSFSLDMVPKIRHMIRPGSFHGLRVLDLACGSGSAAIEIAKHGANVLGIDCSEGMLDLARKRPGPRGAK